MIDACLPTVLSSIISAIALATAEAAPLLCQSATRGQVGDGGSSLPALHSSWSDGGSEGGSRGEIRGATPFLAQKKKLGFLKS